MKSIPKLLVLLVLVLNGACAQQLLVRSSDFMVPRVSDQIFSGKIGVGVESPTGIDLYNDSDSDFPHITPKLSTSVPTLISYANASMVFLPRLEAYYLDKTIGAKWQFLTLGNQAEWLLAVKAGAGHFNQENTLSYDKARSAKYSVNHKELGLSLGYALLPQTLFYFSLVQHQYDLDSSSSSTKTYKDSGIHRNFGLGVDYRIPSSFLWMKEFHSTAEIVNQIIKWDGMSGNKGRTSIAFSLGFDW